MRFLIRYIHKYLSFFISLQLLLWTISGIFFAFNKIELVRGEQYRLIPNYSFNLSNFDFEIYDAINVKVMKRLGEDILVSKRELNTKYLDIDGKSIAKIS